MKDSIYLAYRYLTYNRVRSLVLTFSVAIIIFLPVGLKRLISESEDQMLARANSTPLIAGKKGSPTDLVINTLYFQQEKIETLTMEYAAILDETGFGYSIPVMSSYSARGFPIVGTSLDYFDFRDLSPESGRLFGVVGECVIGSNVARRLDIQAGDSLISSPESFFDFAGVYPLKMDIVGVLDHSNTPDDDAIFVDVKTTWIIMGLGHGHQDLVQVYDPTIVLERSDSTVTAGAKLFMYNQIDPENIDDFHFHGDINSYPITSIIFIPENQKASALLRGRIESGEIDNQIVVPTLVVDNLLQSIFRIKQIFNSVFVIVGLAVSLIFGLVIVLSLRLRKDELYTMFTIGSGKRKIAQIIGMELLLLVVTSALISGIMYYITGFFIDEFMNAFII
jgi:putative ABC transport system permease protein